MKNYHKIDSFGILLCEIPVAQAYLQNLIYANYVPSCLVFLDIDNIKKNDSLFVKLYKKIPWKLKLIILNPFLKSVKNKVNFNLKEKVITTLKKNDLEYHSLKVKSVNDPILHSFLKSRNEKYFLYTGGGICRDIFLNLGKKILHIHPGYLPYVRGSNGLLFSNLVRGISGMTCFFMDKGIDTGDIIMKREFDQIKLKLSYLFNFVPRLSLIMIQTALDYKYDSDMRAKLLMEVLPKIISDNITSIPQNLEEGNTYYHIHPVISSLILKNKLV